MRDAPALIAIVDHVAGVATVTVCGEFDAFTFSRLRDRLTWVVADNPQLLVLDLGTSGRFTGPIRALIAARRQVPSGCLLEVRSANPAVHRLLKLAGGRGALVTANWQVAEPARSAGQGPG